VKCSTCNAEIKRITVTVDPRQAALEFRANCTHELTADEARTGWRLKIPMTEIPDVTGATLIAAERGRQITEEGHTPEADAELVGGELSWAVWALIDTALSNREVEQAPSVWPERLRGDWPAGKSKVRKLIIAGALIAAEIDRLRADGETP
jgi:hypothetical protein